MQAQFVLVFCFENYLHHVRPLWNVPIRDILHKVKLQCLSPAIMDVSFTLGEIEERDFEVAAQPGQDNTSVCTCTGFCLRETGRNACPCNSAQQFCTSSCHRARGTTSLWMNTRCVAGRFFRKWRGIKDYLFLHVEHFPYSSKHALYFINYLCFFYCHEDNIPSCEAHKQFGAEPAQYELEINFNSLKITRSKKQLLQGAVTECRVTLIDLIYMCQHSCLGVGVPLRVSNPNPV